MKISDFLPFVPAVSFTVALLALGNSILAFRLSRRVNTSDFQATQKVKVDTTALIAALRGIMVKGAVYSQQDSTLRKKKDYPRYVDLTAEKKVVQDFLCSPTAIAYHSYLTDKSKKASESGEEWRTFFLQAAELLSEDNQYAAAKRAARLEKLFHPIEAEDFVGISRYLQDLSAALKRLFDNIPHDTLIAALMATSEPEAGPDIFREFVIFLKEEKKISDPDLDLFYGVFLNNEAIMDDALARGANLQADAGELLKRYNPLFEEFRARTG
jgi:hypothetical protein